MEQAIDHKMDGIDPDQRTRLPRESWQWCENAADDAKALREMSESDLKHYAGTPSFSKKAKSRGANGYR